MSHPAAHELATGPAVRSLGGPIGAEIIGLDVAGGLDAAGFASLCDALHQHGVVVLRGQTLAPDDQLVLGQRLGEIRTSFYNRYSVPERPELSIVSNIERDGVAIGIADAGMLWHTDASYLRRPDLYTLLYGIEIPMEGGRALGDTLFSSTALAYEALPADMRARLEGLRAIHSFEEHLEKKRKANNLKRAPLTAEQKAALPDVDHPVVRTHPVTGRRCLFVSEGHTKTIQGMDEAQAQALLQTLWDQIRNPAFHYRHSWRPGDLVIWDNCLVQHLAVFDYGRIPRRLHRLGVLGPVPA